MPRAKNAVASRARRKKVLKQTRGNFGARKNVWTIAKNTYEKGLTYAFRDRRKKKSEFRALWIQRINAAVRLEGLSYSKFMGLCGCKGERICKVIIKTLYPENRSWMPDFEVWHPIFCWIFSRKWSNNINFGRTK